MFAVKLEPTYEGFMTKIVLAMVAVAAAAFTTGCSGDVQPGSGREVPTGETTFGDEDTSGVFSGVTADLPPNQDRIQTKFRDISSYAFHVGEEQRIGQWLISENGTTYRNRECTIRGEDVDFRSCTPWSSEFAIADLGLPGVGNVEGMSAFVLVDDQGREILTQRIFSKLGAIMNERQCVFSDDGKLECDKWTQLRAAELGIEGAKIFRDDTTIVFRNADGLNVVSQAVLATDGNKVWERQCVVDAGATTFSNADCAFGEAATLEHLDIPVRIVSGRSGYAFESHHKMFYAETVFASTQEDAGRRICEMSDTGVDFSKCSEWTDIIIGNAVTYNGAL